MADHDAAMIPEAPITEPSNVVAAVRDRGWAVVDAPGLASLLDVDASALPALATSWNALPPDAWLKDGGKYRARRHSCFIVDTSGVDGVVARVPHRAHWQSVSYNALHGGIERWFEPIDDVVSSDPQWVRMLAKLGALFDVLKPADQGDARWFVEAHQFRIDTTAGIGRPTPEGAHRDGVDFVVVVLVDRLAVKGGETRVFEAVGTGGVRFVLTEPWSALLLDDARVIHETTPIQPMQPMQPGHRDTLVVTLRRGSFQGP